MQNPLIQSTSTNPLIAVLLLTDDATSSTVRSLALMRDCARKRTTSFFIAVTANVARSAVLSSAYKDKSLFVTLVIQNDAFRALITCIEDEHRRFGETS